MKEKSHYLIVGLVVNLAIVILVFGIMFLNDKDPREKRIPYYILFDQVSTLTMGDPVKINGVKLGKVTAIELLNRKVIVCIEVRNDIQIPVNSEVKVQNIGLMGERQIGIQMGLSNQFLKQGDTLAGKFDAGISEAMGYAGEVFDSTRILVGLLRRVVDSTIAEPQFVPAFHSVLNKTILLENRVDTLLSKTSPMLITSLKNLEQTSARLNELVKNQEKPVNQLVADASGLTQDANALLKRVDSLTTQLQFIVKKVQTQDNTLGVLLNDNKLHTNLNNTVQTADSLFNSILKYGLDVNIDIF